MTESGRRVAVVTGAGSGIGRATATRLAESGYSVLALDRDPDGVAETVSGLVALGAEAEAFVADVTDESAIQEAGPRAVERFGGIDAVMACAGIEVTGAVLDTDLASWNRALSVNLTGTFLTAKATMPSLIASRGAFVAIASDVGVTGAQGYAAYTASKHGVVGLVRCLALDYGPVGVRSNAVCPGFVETPMARRLLAGDVGASEEFFTAAIPLGRFASPVEVADTMIHLATSPYANGVIYSLDGGSTAGYFSSDEVTPSA